MSYHIDTSNEEHLIHSGIQSILEAFKTQKEKYSSLISSLQQTISTLTAQNTYLQSELSKTSSHLKPHSLPIQPSNPPQPSFPKDQSPISFKTNININNEQSNFLSDKVFSSQSNKNTPTHNKSHFLSSRMNQTSTRNYKNIRERNSKHNAIQLKIDSLKTNASYKQYLTTSDCKGEESGIEGKEESIRKGMMSLNYQDRSQLSMRSKQYQMTNRFIQECKLVLNANNYEKVVNVLKEPKKENNKYKVYKIINGNRKLVQMFDSIYN